MNGGLRDCLTSQPAIDSLLNNKPNNVGAAIYAKQVAQDVKYYSTKLDAIDKISRAFGTAMIVADVGMNAYDNIENDASSEKIVSDAAVDTVVDVTGALISGAIAGAVTGAIAGSVAPGVGNLVGAVVGLLIGIFYTIFTDVIEINGKSFREWFKEDTLAMVTSIENWIKEGITDVQNVFAKTECGLE